MNPDLSLISTNTFLPEVHDLPHTNDHEKKKDKRVIPTSTRDQKCCEKESSVLVPLKSRRAKKRPFGMASVKYMKVSE